MNFKNKYVFLVGFFTFQLVVQSVWAADCAVPSSYTTIQTAIDDANCSVINVADGTYKENLVIERSLTLQGGGKASAVTIDGNAAGRVIKIAATDYSHTTIEIKNVTITNGKADADGGGISDGIEDKNLGSTLILSNVVIEKNSAVDRGGGIYSWTTSGLGSVTVNDSAVRNNSSEYGAGAFFSGDASINRSSIDNNESTSSGGGMYINYGKVLVNYSTIASNKAGGNGAGVRQDGGEVTEFRNVTFSGNSATKEGGAYYNSDDGRTDDPFFYASLIAKNSPENCKVFSTDSKVAGQEYNLDSDGTCELSSTDHNLVQSVRLNQYSKGIQTFYLPYFKNASPIIDGVKSATSAFTDQIGTTGPLIGKDGGTTAYGDIGAIEYSNAIKYRQVNSPKGNSSKGK